jgi:CRP-like cAMP-binding protein
MNNQSTQYEIAQPLSTNDREALIAKYPLFALLSHKDIRELAAIAKEVKVQTGTVITKENDIVDSVYLIVSGRAKVIKAAVGAEKMPPIELAILKNGDAIGLAGTGFFSHRGIRTATVIAMEPMVLLSMDLRDFQLFLQKPGMVSPALKNTGDKILLMNFIHQSNLFKGFSIDKIHWLAKNIKKIELRPGAIIYKEDDAANEFYFIVTGSVSVTKVVQDVTMTRLYEASNIFGEGSFIANTKRKSIARVETDCELFVLEREMILAVDELKQSVLQNLSKFIKGLWNK